MNIFLKVLMIIGIILAVFFVITSLIYWFNLDTKLVKLLEKPMTKHYDKMKRDRKI